jgi:ribose/xylose/arabinose/galactoside ABC-type transport system permease subunit
VVTLATLSMFRGIAEGITQGAVNYTDFPKSFLFMGQGYLMGVIPIQLAVLLIVFLGYWILLHRSVFGRALYAIGFSPRGQVMRAFQFAGGSEWFTSCPASCPVWPPSSTRPT